MVVGGFTYIDGDADVFEKSHVYTRSGLGGRDTLTVFRTTTGYAMNICGDPVGFAELDADTQEIVKSITKSWH